MKNAFLALRQDCIAQSTRPFLARGSSVKRCEHCLLHHQFCICNARSAVQTNVDIVLLMHRDEVFKPTNTGRLIADVIPFNTHAFVWSRTAPPAQLIQLLTDKARKCVLVFPAEVGSNSDSESRPIWQPSAVQNTNAVQDNKNVTLIVPDGTWRQASRMVRLSPYLSGMPCVSLGEARAQYLVRKAPREGQLSTAEAVGQALLGLGEVKAGEQLLSYFDLFNARYAQSRGR